MSFSSVFCVVLIQDLILAGLISRYHALGIYERFDARYLHTKVYSIRTLCLDCAAYCSSRNRAVVTRLRGDNGGTFRVNEPGGIALFSLLPPFHCH